MRRPSRITIGIAAFLTWFAILPAATASARVAALEVETVALFDAGVFETPESIAIDNHNNKYVSLALTGEIRKIAADGMQSTFARLPLGGPPLTFCGPFFAGLTGITLDAHDNLYANLASCDLDSRGIWKLPREGEPRRIAALRLEALPNGIVHHNGQVYAADSTLGGSTRAVCSATTSPSTCTATSTVEPTRSIQWCALRPMDRSRRYSPRPTAWMGRPPLHLVAKATGSTCT